MLDFWSGILAWIWRWLDFLLLLVPLAWAVFMLERVDALKREISGLHACLDYIQNRKICEACYSRAEREYQATLSKTRPSATNCTPNPGTAPTVPPIGPASNEAVAAADAMKYQIADSYFSEPTVAPALQTAPQATAGSNGKVHRSIGGLDIFIETVTGHTRYGVGEDGRPWSVQTPADYGHIDRSECADGDPVDVFVKAGATTTAPMKPVFVIEQTDAETEEFDEHKVMIGYENAAEALADYHASFSDGSGPLRLGNVSMMQFDDFKAWVQNADTAKWGPHHPGAQSVPDEDRWPPQTSLQAQLATQAQEASACKRAGDLAYLRRSRSMRRGTPMQFGPLLAEALRQHDPKTFNHIANKGQLNAWMQAREREVVARLEDILAKEPRNFEGQVANPDAIRAAEQVIAANLTEFLINFDLDFPNPISDQIHNAT